LTRLCRPGQTSRHEAPKYLSPTDPAAAWSIKHGVGVFAYETNLLVDTAHGIIVDVEATPARLKARFERGCGPGLTV